MISQDCKKKTRPKKESLTVNLRKYWPYYVMVLPGVLYLLIFRYIPMFGSVIAFTDYKITKGILWNMTNSFVGLENFVKLLKYDKFGEILGNTLVLGLIKSILIFPIPVLLALSINEVRNQKLKKAVQTAVYIPYFLSWVIIGGLVFDIFGQNGIFNNVRELLGMDRILVMMKDSWFRPIFAISSIWKEAGWGTVVYLAAISGIDQSVYESATLDGASRFQKMRYITVPLLVPTVITMFLLGIGGFLELGFEQVYNLSFVRTSSTIHVADIFDTYIYRESIIGGGNYGLTTAIGLFQSVVGLLFVTIFNKLANKFTEDGGLW